MSQPAEVIPQAIVIWTDYLQGCLNPPNGGGKPDWRTSIEPVAARSIAAYIDRTGLGNHEVLLVVDDSAVAMFDANATRGLESLFVYDGARGERGFLATTWFNDGHAYSPPEKGTVDGTVLVGGALKTLAQALQATSQGGTVTSLGRLLLEEALHFSAAENNGREESAAWGRIILGWNSTLVVAANRDGKRMTHRVIPVGANHLAIPMGSDPRADIFAAWKAPDTRGWWNLPQGVKDAYPAVALLAQGLLLALEDLFSAKGQRVGLAGHSVEESLISVWKPLESWVNAQLDGGGCDIIAVTPMDTMGDLRNALQSFPATWETKKQESLCKHLGLYVVERRKVSIADPAPVRIDGIDHDGAEESGKTVIGAPEFDRFSGPPSVGRRGLRGLWRPRQDGDHPAGPARRSTLSLNLHAWWQTVTDHLQRVENGRGWKTDLIGWLAGGLAGIALSGLILGAYYTIWSKSPDANASYPSMFEVYARAVRGQAAGGPKAMAGSGLWTRRLQAMATVQQELVSGAGGGASRLWLRAVRVDSRSLPGQGRVSVMTIEGRALQIGAAGLEGGTGPSVLQVNRFIESLSASSDFMASASSLRLASVKDSRERPGMLDFSLEVVFTPPAAR